MIEDKTPRLSDPDIALASRENLNTCGQEGEQSGHTQANKDIRMQS